MIFYEPVFKIMSPQGDWCEMPRGELRSGDGNGL
jgi:hypothetical protein